MIVLSWLVIATMVLAETTDESEKSNHVQAAGKIDILVRQLSDECKQLKDEIVVCGEKLDNERHRLAPSSNAEKFEKKHLVSKFPISENATIAGETEAYVLAAGVQSNRLMVRLKVKF